MKRNICARKTQCVWLPITKRQGAAGVTYTIMQNIMKTFHKAMKIRKYLRLSRNSLMLSPTNQKSP